MQVGRQMLQEEAQGLMNGLLFDHLIIIHHEHEVGRMRLAAFQLMEQGCQDGRKRR